MNTSNSIFKSDKLRYALLYATDTAELEMPFGYTVADGAVPPSVKIRSAAIVMLWAARQW